MPKTFYVGIKAIIVEDDKLLLLKCIDNSGRCRWDLPGGRMEPGETIADALARELLEELAIEDFAIQDLHDVHKLPFDLSDGQGLMLLLYKVKADIRKMALSDEHSGYTWIDKAKWATIAQEAAIDPEMYTMLSKVFE